MHRPSDYYSDDPRDHARDRSVLNVVIWEGDTEITVDLPVKYEVCDLCEGRGKYVNPSIDAHGISAEEFAEDPDFAEEYFRGSYDVPCGQCKGQRVMAVADVAKCSFEQKRALVTYRKQERENARYEAISRAERRMGA